MEDSQILDLYWARNEDAIRETEVSYGGRLYALADRILQCHEDSQESVSDTYMTAWNTIPPQRPNYFFAYLAKICRNCAFGILDWKNAAKRKADVVFLSEEMEQCIPDPRHDRRMEGEELGRLLNGFLGELERENRLIFLRRYWYADSVAEIAARYGISESKVKTRLYRLRQKLQHYLEKEGTWV